MRRGWCASVGRRAAFALASFARSPRLSQGSRGRLLAEATKSGDVVLIWALNCDLNSSKLQDALEKLSPISTRVLVTTSLNIREAGQTGCMVEAIPDASVLTRANDKDWAVYLERRFARIRESWDPDLEVRVGDTIEAFLSDLTSPDTAHSELLNSSIFPEDDSETSAARAG